MSHAAAEAILARAYEAWRPPPRLNLSDWAEAHFYLSPESSAEAGRWHTIPYQKGILNAITDPAVTYVTLMKSARLGYTKCMDATIGYYMHQDPCPIMVVQPTLDDAEGYSKEEIAPMLRDCPTLARLVPAPKTRHSDSTILFKKFPGGSLSIIGANSPRGFRRVSRKIILFDEVDGYPPSAGAEGDQIQLGIRRSEYYWDRKILRGSTPTTLGRSRIQAAFLAGDQRRYYVPCPHCGTMQILVWAQIRWPKHPPRPEQAVYVCIDCGAEIAHRQQRGMVAAGEWRPGPHAQFPDIPAPAPFSGHASFHLWAAYSYSPNATWGQLASEWVEAHHAGPESLKTFINTALGEPWQERGEAPEWQMLYARREPYRTGTCPRGVCFLTLGVDVQKDRLVYELVGWGRDKRSWSIETAILPGDTSDAVKGPWPALDALLMRTFAHEGGQVLPIAMAAVDSGFNTQQVYAWARTHPMSRVIAVRGVPTAHVLIGAPSRVDVTISGRRMKGGYKVWPVGSHLAKSELYGWLGLPAPTGNPPGPTPPGYCHFPEYGEEYFRQLTAEQLVPHTTKGYTIFAWELIPGRENHQLDARVYARAAAAVIGLDRFRETDWQALEHQLGVTPQTPVPPETSGPPAPAIPPAPAAPRRSSPSWIPRRRGGWLR